NPDGSNQVELTFESGRSPNLPAYVPVDDYFCKWSPDGTKIAFKSNRNLDPNNLDAEAYTMYVMDYQSQNIRPLVLDQLPILSSDPNAEIAGFEWSPDSTKFALSYGQTFVSFGGDEKLTWNIYSVNVDGSGLTKLTNDLHVVNGAATWSPDGNRIAFISGTTIEMMNAD